MCAIAGMIGSVMNKTLMEAMLRSMAHRGPDGSGSYIDGNAALLHSRLAIIDPEGGVQPMGLNWDGEQYILVYNGELYNTEELRRELKLLGHEFRTHSDTEVVLHAYAAFGENCVHKFNGIYAFAVWEMKRKRLFLCRDRIGVKPLFYSCRKEGLVFSSEIKTILTVPWIPREIDAQGTAQLILLGPGRLPGSGIFRGIQELEPGCCGYYENGQLTICRYWWLKDREHRESFEETVECVRWLVLDAIQRQMVSDVPIGTFLSGGLDSSIITAVCAKELATKGERLKTFSVGYQNNDRYFVANPFQPESDDDYIRLISDHCDTDHRTTLLSPEELAASLESATIARDLPGMADVDFSLLAFCGQIRPYVRVALSGECADEIFGGYPWYRDPKIRSCEGFPWAQNTNDRISLMKNRSAIDPEEFIMDNYLDTCRSSDILPGASETERRMKEMVNLNFRWFMQTLLDRKDRMSMHHGLEVRVPFCDYRIAEYLYSVPWEFKDYQGREKGLLRAAMEGIIPQQVLYRKKSPYPKTFDPRYERLVEERLQSLFSKKTLLWEIISQHEFKNLLSRESQWPWYGQLMRRPQLMAYVLQLDFWLEHYSINLCY